MIKEKNNDNNEDRVGHSDQLTGTECKETQSACSLINGPQKIMERKEKSEVRTGWVVKSVAETGETSALSAASRMLLLNMNMKMKMKMKMREWCYTSLAIRPSTKRSSNSTFKLAVFFVFLRIRTNRKWCCQERTTNHKTQKTHKKNQPPPQLVGHAGAHAG